MWQGSAALLSGILIVAHLRVLPDPFWTGFLPMLLWLGWRNARLRVPALLLSGMLWAALHAHIMLGDVLPADLQKQPLTVTGVIHGVPVSRHASLRFAFDVETMAQEGRPVAFRERLSLSWHQPTQLPRPGERWSFTVKLKRPHGYRNAGGFDYERYLFVHGIRASGYVVDAATARRLGDAAAGFDAVRASLAQQFAGLSAEFAHPAILQALAIGLKHGITDHDWDLLRDTGTNHLMAISGLHIGLVAGLVLVVLQAILKRLSIGHGRWPAQRLALLPASLAAFVYAGLAGFALPTQRALLMLLGATLPLLFGLAVRPGMLLPLAAVVVLLLQPFAVLEPGFWLSFAAVAGILYALQGRKGQGAAWQRVGRVHVVVTLALVPVLAMFFGELPLVSPLANLIAVPMVSALVVPMVLLGMALLPMAPDIAVIPLQLADFVLDGVWQWLSGVSALAPGWQLHGTPGLLALCLAALGVLLLLAPRGIPLRWAGWLLLLPLLVAPPAPLPADRFRVAVLDVGQGLSVVVQTQRHSLVYDVGPRFASGFNLGSAVVAPYLRSRGISRLDALVLSHGDTDHDGGMQGLLREIPANRIYTGGSASAGQALRCAAGQHWQWDGVSFEFVFPFGRRLKHENDQSCVLKVSYARDVVLLPGDMSSAVERRLLRQGVDLRSTLLVTPHHGSLSSSSSAFVRAAAPRYAVHTTGYLNRYRFPKPAIVARYAQQGTQQFNTALSGQLTFVFDGRGKPRVHAHRHTHDRFWNASRQP